jgi:predicted alpha/beta-hydrolase family hydrolase
MGLRVFIGHGASGNAASMAPHVEGLRRRGFEATAIGLPVRRAEEALPVFHSIVPNAPDVVPGGQSFGGRVASLAAAEADAAYAGLVCFSFPLHRPGGAATWEERAAHLTKIRCPVLLLSGEADPMARLELLREAARRIPRAELVTYPRLGHTLKPVLEDVLDRVAEFLATLNHPEPARK